MPANLTPQYSKAEEEFRKATTPAERLEKLREMLRLLPKHKGTEKLQAELKQKISVLMIPNKTLETPNYRLERLKHDAGRTYADLVYNGLWFTPTREAIYAFVAKIQERVTGTIRLKLFKGDCRVVGRKSPYALYEHALATYDAGDLFDHSAAEGFIKIWGLPVETAARKAPRDEKAARQDKVSIGS